MSKETNHLVLTLLISMLAVAISLVRYTNERIRSQAATVNAYYDILKLIDNDRTVELRGLLRASEELNRLKGLESRRG